MSAVVTYGAAAAGGDVAATQCVVVTWDAVVVIRWLRLTEEQTFINKDQRTTDPPLP